MLPSAVVTAASVQTPPYAPPPHHSHILSPLEVFGPYGMYIEKQLSPCAVRLHPDLIDMRQRRVIGKHEFSHIDLD
jgi:hypothetical protein